MSLVPPPGKAVGRLAASCLALEAFLVLFAVLAAVGLSALPDAVVWGAGGGLALACLLTAGVVRTRPGLWLGTVLQVLVLATGFWVPAMFFLGGIFAALWVWFLRLGGRIDRETAARRA
ncbi:MAG: DUF4233 domain-containing protein [Actinomycetes bacterium]